MVLQSFTKKVARAVVKGSARLLSEQVSFKRT